jgi:hypothetical protein
LTRIRVSIPVDVPPRRLWADLQDIASHVEWMHDAVAIRFTSRQRRGVGTTFDCDTKVGPLRTTDHMEVTEWRPGKAMGIRHVGVVTGTGVFRLKRRRGGTRLVWEERLRFPLWVGGPLAGLAAKPVLRAVWRRNLRNLKKRVESS